MPQTYSCVPNGVPPTQLVNNTGAGTPVLSYAIGFPYISSTDIVVFTGDTKNWTQRAQGTGANEYQVNPKGGLATDSVVFNGAVAGANILIWRRTDLCDMSREFQPGSSIRAQDLNQDFTQLLMVLQESAALINNIFDGGDGGGGLPNPGDKIELDDLGDVDVSGATNRSYLAYDGTGWGDADVIRSTDGWSSNDTAIATTAAGDARWLNSDASDITGGPGIDVTASGGTVEIAADLASNAGLDYFGSPAVNSKIGVVPGKGITTDSNGVNVGQGTGIIVNTNDVAVNSVTLWGQTHDHSGNVSGNVSAVGTVQFGSGTTYTFPSSDTSQNGKVLTTDGSGNLTWTSKTTDTTYTYTSAQDGNDVNLVLTDETDSSTDTIKLVKGSNITLTDDGSNNVTIEADNTTYKLEALANGTNVDLNLLDASDDSIVDTVTVKAGVNVSLSTSNAGEFTINSTGGGGSGGATIVDDIAQLNTAGAVPPSAGDLFMVLDSTGAASASPAIDSLPAAPGAGWSSVYTLLVQWKTTTWQYIRYDVADPDSQYLRLNAGTAAQAVAGTGKVSFAGNVEFSGDGDAKQSVGIYGSGGFMRLRVDGAAAPLAIKNNTTYVNLINSDGSLEIGGDIAKNKPNIELSANGNADFAGEVNVGDIDGSSNGVEIRPVGLLYVRNDSGTSGETAFAAYQGGYSRSDRVFEVMYDGSGSFAGNVISGGTPYLAQVGASLSAGGAVEACRAESNGAVFVGYKKDNTTGTSTIFADGSATFGGLVEADSLKIKEGTFSGAVLLDGNVGGNGNTHGLVQILGGGAGNPSEVFNVYDGSDTRVSFKGDGSASFAGSVSIGGTDDSHTMDEYEEGTWTPTFTGFTFGGSQPIYKIFTKIGRMVHIGIRFQASTTCTAGATMTIPFAGTLYPATGVCIVTSTANGRPASTAAVNVGYNGNGGNTVKFDALTVGANEAADLLLTLQTNTQPVTA